MGWKSLKGATTSLLPIHTAQKLSLSHPGRRKKFILLKIWTSEDCVLSHRWKKARGITLKTERLSESPHMDQWDPPGSLLPSAARTWVFGLNSLLTTLFTPTPPCTHFQVERWRTDCSLEILKCTQQRPNDLDFWGLSKQNIGYPLKRPPVGKSQLSTENFQFAFCALYLNIISQGLPGLEGNF